MSERWRQFVPDDGPRTDGRSDMIIARSQKKAAGHNLSFCPFGCKTDSEDLDPQGYCRHLVGFTLPSLPGEEKFFHALKYRPNKSGHRSADDYRYVDGTDVQPILKTDKIERGGVSCRVYRNVDEVAEESDLPKATVPTPEVTSEPKPKKRPGPPKGYKKKKTETAPEPAAV